MNSTLKNMITISRLILCKHLFQQSQFYTNGYVLLLAFFKLDFFNEEGCYSEVEPYSHGWQAGQVEIFTMWKKKSFFF